MREMPMLLGGAGALAVLHIAGVVGSYLRLNVLAPTAALFRAAMVRVIDSRGRPYLLLCVGLEAIEAGPIMIRILNGRSGLICSATHR